MFDGVWITFIYSLSLKDGSPESLLHSALFIPASLQHIVPDGNGNCVRMQAQDPPKTSV